MTEFNNKYVPKAPKTFQVVELKGPQIKQSNLSAAARNKIINRSGGNYLSENSEGYGPCSSYNCDHYLSQGFVSLHLACPATNCRGDGQAYQWTHGSGCGGPMYINADANLKCMKEGCGKTGYISN